MNKLAAYLHLMRPINCTLMGLAVIIGAALSGTPNLNQLWQNLVLGFVTAFALTAASMAINDYCDREIDAVNEPHRPIPSGKIKPKEALAFALALTAVGFVSAFLTNLLCFLTSIAAWLLFTAYAVFGKRSGLFGNFLVSACVATPFIYGNLTVASEISMNMRLLATMAFLSNTGREITKGIADVQGDKKENVKTLAVRYGEKTAAIAAVIFYVSGALLSPLPWFLGLVSFWFLPLVAVTDAGLAVSSFLLLRDYSRENAKKVKNIVLLCFFFGMLAFAAGFFP
ncbi:MAG: geranylgeranylglycerol-phosphate geranylgeranyltransferase [Candidatus Bathyarchaeia archaeon]